MRLWVRLLAAVIAAVAAMPLVMAPHVAHAQAAAVTEFAVPGANPTPFGIVTGPDGNLWFTDSNSSNIGNVTPSGTFTEFGLPSNGSAAGMTVGPDGNIWFADYGAGEIGKTTTAGAITEYPVPTANSVDEFITAGPDGNLWFTEGGADKVGKITTSGTITEYSVSSGAGLQFITPGPDGNLWFTERSLDKVGRITPGGTVTEFPLTAGAGPNGIVAGPDGNLWFTENGSNNIGRISTSGTGYTEFPVPTSGSNLWGITAGPDGNLWFAEFSASAVGRVSITGVVTEFAFGTSSAPLGITTGPDGNIWYAAYHGSVIGRLALGTCASVADSASPSPVGPGASEAVSVALTGCGVTDLPSSTTTTTTTAPSGCPAAPPIPSFATPPLPFGQTDPHATTFAAPSCLGTYTVDSQTTVGSTVMATGATSYTVQLACLSDSAAPSSVGPGASESISITLSACDGLDVNSATTATTTTVPPSCPPAPAIPSYADSVTSGQSSTHMATFSAPTCAGNYNITSQTTIGTTVVATAATTYHVFAAGDGLLFNTPTRPGFGAVGSDGNLWFTDCCGTQADLIRLTPDGTVNYFQPFQSGVIGQQMVSGSDGNLYVSLGSTIAQISTSPVINWEVPVRGNIRAMTPGPDGNVWFASEDSLSTPHVWVGSLSPSGKVKQFLLASGIGNPQAITAGADGALWFPLDSAKIGRITTTGTVTSFPIPTDLIFGGGAGVPGATLGPDGNVWFTSGTENGPNYVFRVTPAGVVSQFTLPSSSSLASGITAGADGNLWVNEAQLPGPSGCGGGVARVTPAGVMTEFNGDCQDFNDRINIVAGPDGNVWNGAFYGIGIERIEVGATGACKPIGATASSANVARGSPEMITATVANCATVPGLLTIATKVIPPPSCRSAVSSSVHVPLQPLVQTMTTSVAPSKCRGSYKVKLTLSSGPTPVGTATVTYQVT